MFERNVAVARRRAWMLLLATSLLGLILPPVLGFSVDLGSFYPLYALAGAFMLFLPYTRRRGLAPLHAALECVVINLCALTPLVALSYAAMRAGLPLADVRLGAMDGALGWSSAGFVQAMQPHPRLGELLLNAYGALLPQALLLPFLLVLTGRVARSYQLVSGYIVVSLIAFACSVPFPSHGALMGQGVDPRDLQHLSRQECLDFIASLDGVRGAAGFVLSLHNASGVITFPSIHAAMAALFSWAIWPVRRVRCPVIALNALMMLSALACGGHYLVDVIAGNAVLLVAVAIVTNPPVAWQDLVPRRIAGLRPRDAGHALSRYPAA